MSWRNSIKTDNRSKSWRDTITVSPKWEDTEEVTASTPRWDETTELPPIKRRFISDDEMSKMEKSSGKFISDEQMAQLEQSQPSTAESIARGGIQGFTLGFADEATAGLESLLTDKTYDQALKESRANYHAAEEANPASYMTSNVAGAIGTSLIPGLNVAKAATFAGRVGTSALGGALSGLGNSEATDAKGLAIDTGIGAGLSVLGQGTAEKAVAPAIQKVGSFTDKIMQAAANKSPTANRLLAKVAQLTSGVDQDAALRQIERPAQTAAAESDDFAFKIGKQAVHDTETLGNMLGQNVGSAKRNFLQKSGDDMFFDTDVLECGR